MYSIEQFQSINHVPSFVITQHSRKRFSERGITIADICTAIQNGEIIEQYPDDKPFPSCLIFAMAGKRPLHVCASIDEDLIYLITAYEPDPIKWEQDWKTRKEKNG